MHTNNQTTVYQQGDLRIVVPGHAQRRARERGDFHDLFPAMAALRRRPDIGRDQPIALVGERATVIFEFRRRDKKRAVVATVLPPDARRIGADTLIIPAAWALKSQPQPHKEAA